MIQVVGRHGFLLAMCFLAKTTLPGFHTDQPFSLSKCQVARKKTTILFSAKPLPRKMQHNKFD
jgi:hypothetical protein